MNKNPILYNTFGKVIKLLRDNKGMTQLKLAEDADLSERYIIDIEGGKRNVTLDVLLSLATALDTCPSTILKEVEIRIKEEL
ncbi:helix-turn-helix domain-containing protein [Alkalihalobacterium elongatum]|uniref:helix-turn-helix domain-containing protein n=1 Tax=Alkalihalobacterium elongatum TaxID=2675466 RepID=UPI001C1FE5BF|nr:helix-turn-helix domain-containing protein [Alkalihalobacterium elongatum]